MTSVDEHFKSIFQSSGGKLGSSEDSAPFIASDRYTNPKPGYFFTTGNQGTGYYIDKRSVKNISNDILEREGKKRRRDEDTDKEGEDTKRAAVSSKENDIEQLLEEAEKSGLAQLDSNSLKQMLLNFEKKINKNQKLRMKYPTDPEKFMESEVELNDQIQELYAIAAYPELYIDFIGNGSLPSVLGMITHENTDISISTIGLLQEMLESDTIQESPDSIILLEEFVKNQGLELITQNLLRLDDSNEEDSQGVFNTLSILENLVEIKEDMATVIGTSTNIFQYLLNKVRSKKFDGNKLYASEILSILLQPSRKNRLEIGTMTLPDDQSNASNGMDALLQAIAPYRKRQPASLDETEMLDNLFLCLFSLLAGRGNQMKFIDVEGFDLMIRCLKEKKHAAGRAVKAISYAVSNNTIASVKFIEVGGLKYLFPILLGRGLPVDLEKKKANHPDRVEVEKAAITAVSQLCINLLVLDKEEVSPSSFQESQQRLVGKFIENEYEKVDRCVEIFLKYNNQISLIEKEIGEDLENGDDELDDDEILAKRLDAGLSTLQESAFLLVYASLIDTKILNKVELKLDMEKLNIVHVMEVVDEYIAILMENVNESKKQREEDDGLDLQESIDNDERTINRLQHAKNIITDILVKIGKVEIEDESVENIN